MHNLISTLLIVIFATLTTPVFAKTTLTMGVVDPNIVGPTQFILNRIVESDQSIAFKVTSYPRQRLLVELNNGTIDGDASRYLEARSRIEQNYPNIRVLTESIMTLDWVLISTEKNAPSKVRTLNDLKDRRFAIPRGSIVGEKLFTNVQQVGNDQQAVEMLQAGRVDHIIGTQVFGHLFLPVNLPPSLVIQETPIHQARLTLCIHKKHESLIPQIEKLIRTARENGSIRKWIGELISLSRKTK